jgi:hypothetical protein
MQKRREEQKKREKIEHYKQMKEKLEQKEKLRRKRVMEWKKQDKKLAQKEYNYLINQKRYEEEIVLPDLERYKEELKHKREFFKPIDPKEIKEHERKYKKALQEKLEEKKRERMKWYHEIGYGEYDEGKFKTKFLDNFLKHEQRRKEKEEMIKRERLKNVEKADKYAKFVKEMHWPKISKLKRQEMETLKNSVEFNRSFNRSAQSQIIKNRIGTNRSERRKLHKNNDYVSISEPNFSGIKNLKRETNSSYSILKIPKRKWKENRMIPKPMPRKEPKIVDYLKDRRQKREKMESADAKRHLSRNPYLDTKNPSTERHDSKNNSKSKFLNSRSMDNYGIHEKSTIDPKLDRYEKIDRLAKIREKARHIEETAIRKEQLFKLNGSNINDNTNVNDMLIDAITAKLQILEDL